MTFVDNGNGTATLAGTPAAGTGDLRGDHHPAYNGGQPRHPGLHPHGERGAGHHLGKHRKLRGARGQRLDGAATSVTRTAALSKRSRSRNGVSFTRAGRHRLAGGYARRWDGWHLPADHRRLQRHRLRCRAVLRRSTVSGTAFAPSITSAAAATFQEGSSGAFTVTTPTGEPSPQLSESEDPQLSDFLFICMACCCWYLGDWLRAMTHHHSWHQCW